MGTVLRVFDGAWGGTAKRIARVGAHELAEYAALFRPTGYGLRKVPVRVGAKAMLQQLLILALASPVPRLQSFVSRSHRLQPRFA